MKKQYVYLIYFLIVFSAKEDEQICSIIFEAEEKE